MTAKLIVALGIMFSVVLASDAHALIIPAQDLDMWITGPADPGSPSLPDDFVTAAPPPPINGAIVNNVYFDGTNYTYTHTVTPSLANNISFNTAAAIAGFTGDAGWSFSDSGAIGGSGTGVDFVIEEFDGALVWRPQFGPGAGWDAGESVTFFFVSTLRPGIGDYNLTSSEVGTAQSYAPVPEPGSIALLGSGLVGLYAAVRRRRQLQA